MKSPIYGAKARPPVTCPRCGRVFEQPFSVQDAEGHVVNVPGHPIGDPVLCVPLPTLVGAQRDARNRKAGRRG